MSTTPSGRIRVVRIIARLNIGGPAIHSTLLHERLNSARFESTLVTGTEEAGEGNYLELHGRTANVEIIPDLGREIRPLRDVQTLSRLVSLMRRIRPHVVHTHTAKAGAVGRAAAILAGVPAIVHTYHGHVLRGYFSPAKTAVYRGIERSLAWRTDRLLAVTSRVRDELIALGVGTALNIAPCPSVYLAPLLVAERRRASCAPNSAWATRRSWQWAARAIGRTRCLLPPPRCGGRCRARVSSWATASSGRRSSSRPRRSPTDAVRSRLARGHRPPLRRHRRRGADLTQRRLRRWRSSRRWRRACRWSRPRSEAWPMSCSTVSGLLAPMDDAGSPGTS
jgi:hypothetical protein